MLLRSLFIILLSAPLCGAVLGADERGDEDASAGPAPGVSRDLARHRAAHYKNVRYALDLMLKPGAELMEGRAVISVALDAEAGDLVLDWRVVKKDVDPASRVSRVEANGKEVKDARFASEHLIIPRAHLRAGENTVSITFASPVSTSGSAVTRYLDREDGSEYVYTLFVPSDASTAFPCFDQPDLKARFTLRLTAPEGWRVVSNTEGHVQPEFDSTSGGLPQSPPKGMVWHWFPETEPISTYVFAFAAGPFAEFKDDASPLGTRLFVRKSKAERMKKELAEVLRLNREGLDFLAGYFDYKFPFPKYDLVVIPEFAYNGMEHAGATFLREEGVLFPSDPTASDFIVRAELLLHEAAHQWFGDLVTMRWFDDLWLKEGFATFMAYKAIEKVLPQYDAWKAFHLRTKPLAYLTDVTKGTTPIFQEIPNLSAAKSAYGNIVYRKAPAMLRQAEFYLGEREFRRAVQAFVREHAYSNAEWADLVRAFERTSGRKLTAWADAWVKRRGMPDVRVRWEPDRSGRRIRRLLIEQRDALGEGGVWPMRLKVLLARAGATTPDVLTVGLEGRTVEVKEAVGRPAPLFVFANQEDYGYGRFPLDGASRAAVLERFGGVRGDFLRTLLWGSLWESVREAELAPLDYLELAIKYAPEERDEVALAAILARAQTAFTRYLSDEQQAAVASRLEQMLTGRMMLAETPGQRITFYRTFREVATTPEAIKKLRQILVGDLRVPGMTLRSRDRFDIVRVLLALYGDGKDEWVEFITKAVAKQDESDDGRRYAYAVNAARPSPEVKKKYFDAYLNDKDLAESWVEASLQPFNTPRQAALTLPYLEPALGALPQLKRTRKIFFVNGWLAAFVGGQCSPQALDSVQNFLSREPSLDRDLRLKVLEAADALERCVRITRKFGVQSPVRVQSRKVQSPKSGGES